MTQISEMHNQLTEVFQRSEDGRRHVRFFAAIPDELIEFMPGFWWNQDQLFELKVPVIETQVSDLEYLLDVPIWRSTAESSLFTVTARQILDSPHEYPTHWERIHRADTSYSIVMFEKGGSGRILLDGYHRLVHSVVKGLGSIGVKLLPIELRDGILVQEGFLGELNRISCGSTDFVSVARSVAQELLSEDQSGNFPVWK